MNRTYYPHWRDGQFAKVEYLKFSNPNSSNSDYVFNCIPLADILRTATTGKSIQIFIEGKYDGLTTSSFGTTWWITTGTATVVGTDLRIGKGQLNANNKLALLSFNNEANVVYSEELTSEQLTSTDFRLFVNFEGFINAPFNYWTGHLYAGLDLKINDTTWRAYGYDTLEENGTQKQVSLNLADNEYGNVSNFMNGRIYSIIVRDTTAGYANATILCKLTPAKDKVNNRYGFYDEVSKQFFPLRKRGGGYTTTGQGPIVVDNWR